ncbi:LPO_1073/Vpar_1526 family protein [Luteolibacter sp. Populi]|uniref:LPO_1073/Vpar_1526 family protein n=1 Tax=Luteolibacter sp. Populi TaxID=3230487 RepID=UPI0034654C91
MDEFTTNLIAGVIGGFGGKSAEVLWGGGAKLLGLRKHLQKAEENAIVRAGAMLELLSSRIQRLENEAQLNREFIEGAFDEPDLAKLLKQAMQAAASTPSNEMHEILAALVAERITTPHQSSEAILCGLACTAISQATPLHVQLMGSMATIALTDPILLEKPLMKDDRPYLEELRAWFEVNMSGFPELCASPLDIDFMRVINCVSDSGVQTARVNKTPRGIATVITFAGYDVPLRDFEQWPGGSNMRDFLYMPSSSARLTPVGQVIGSLVVNLRRGTRITYKDFDDNEKFRFRSRFPRSK